MIVEIDKDKDGWYYKRSDGVKVQPFATYQAAWDGAIADGHTVGNAGWKRRLLAWNFTSHALQGYPGWEIEREDSPAFVKLEHKAGKESEGISSHNICCEWDDLARVNFYQRDWTEDGIPFVREGETYWSGWWFATITERDRFLDWYNTK